MNVLLINGSPKPKGCTYAALCEIEKSLHAHHIETTHFHIGRKAIHGCIDCGKCETTRRCAFRDIANPCADLMRQADGIIIGSPVYYGSANGALCAMLDRIFYAASADFRHKPAAAIVSCRRGGAGSAFDRLNKYFTISEMPIVSSQYWNAVHGKTPEEVRQDGEGLQIMRTLGNNMAWMLENLRHGKSAIARPEHEERIATNFIR